MIIILISDSDSIFDFMFSSDALIIMPNLLIEAIHVPRLPESDSDNEGEGESDDYDKNYY